MHTTTVVCFYVNQALTEGIFSCLCYRQSFLNYKNKVASYSSSDGIHISGSPEKPKLVRDDIIYFTLASKLIDLAHAPSKVGAQARSCVKGVNIFFSNHF